VEFANRWREGRSEKGCAQQGEGAIFGRGGAGSRDLQSIAHDGEPCLVDPDELDLDPGTAASVEQNLSDTLRRQGKARRGRASEIALLDLTAFSVLSSQPSLLPTCSILPSPSRPGSAIRNPQSLLLRCAALAFRPWMPCCRTDAADAAQPPRATTAQWNLRTTSKELLDGLLLFA
jgi:hypothetical protein